MTRSILLAAALLASVSSAALATVAPPAPAAPGSPPSTISAPPAPPAAAASPPSSPKVGWDIKQGESRTEGRFYTATVYSTKSIYNIEGKLEPAAFVVSCNARGLFVGVVWPDFITHELGDDSAVTIEWHIDDQGYQRSRLGATDRTAIITGVTGLGLLERLSRGKILSLRVPDQDGGQTVTFPITGVQDIYNALVSRGCG